ncbi:hypothetical protein DFH06DRAFT_1122653 [Mycena polygramma]|nr:hypothetical protein DFH06DRAFT_1122653 [Mycena polygramma]
MDSLPEVFNATSSGEGLDLTGEDVRLLIRETLTNCGVDADAIFKGMTATRSFISGSVPVAALGGNKFIPNDVDVYSPETEGDNMLAFLEEEMGYVVKRAIDVNYPDRIAIRRILWLCKDASRINLMFVEGNHPAAAVLQFHSTAVMNIVFLEGFLCLYPLLTLCKLSLMNGTNGDAYERERTARCIEKYSERGITTAKQLSQLNEGKSHTCYVDPNCPATTRRVRDEHGRFFSFAAGGDGKGILEVLGPIEWRLGGTCHNSDENVEHYVGAVGE